MEIDLYIFDSHIDAAPDELLQENGTPTEKGFELLADLDTQGAFV